MSKAELRKEFEAYYADLKADSNANGYRVNKVFEWERFQELHSDYNRSELLRYYA
jgi:hypothetical protein